MTTPQPCTNWYATRRHLSADLRPSNLGNGLEGHSLCSIGSTSVTVFDHSALQDALNRCGSDRKVNPLDEIQECKRCANRAAKLAAGQHAQEETP